MRYTYPPKPSLRDGYRALLLKDGAWLSLFTRGGNDPLSFFFEIAAFAGASAAMGPPQAMAASKSPAHAVVAPSSTFGACSRRQ